MCRRGLRVLVVGLARSGMAASEALVARGASVVACDVDETDRRGEAPRPRCRSPPRKRGGDAATGDRSRRDESGSPGRRPADRGRARPRDSRLERARAGRTLASEPADRHHRDERQDDDDGAPRRDVPRRERPGGGRRQHRPRAHVARRVRGRAGVDRLRGRRRAALGRGHVSAPHRRPPQPRAGPPRPLRHVRVVRRHEAADLRAADGGRHSGAAAGLRARLRRRTPDRVRCRRPPAGRARDPGSPQPCERRGGDGGRTRGGYPGRGDRARRSAPSAASSTASRTSPRSAACAT